MIYLKRWHSEYGPQGLRVIGIHTPEFRFEHDRPNVETYLREKGSLFPVGLDNGYETSKAFQNQVWPEFHLLDREGRIALPREGEGHAHELERAIRDTLGIGGFVSVEYPGDDPDLSRIGTPETYFGAQHPTPQDITQAPRLGTAEYTFVETQVPALNQYPLDDTWLREDERLVLVAAQGGLRFRFSAFQLYIVAAAPRIVTVRVCIDDEEKPQLEIDWPTLNMVVD